MTVRRTLPLLELDPDLGQLLAGDRLNSARAQLHVEVHRLPAGPWTGGSVENTNPEHVGLLILEGIVAREVVVADTVSTELLGPGDMLRPWTLQGGAPLLQLEIRWNALTESRVAILDRRFGSRLPQWPEVNAVLIDRINQRAQRLATTQAISQLNRVDRRLLALFWHLAERFGRVTSDGVAVPLTLSHRMLGQLVGARRPTVSTAISDLAERDELIRRSDGSWLLKGDPVGLPAGEAQRMIPIRRKLIGRLADEPIEISDETAAEAAVLEQRPVVITAARELRSTLDRVRVETSQHVVRTRELAATNERLRQEIASRRAERDAAREDRLARRRSAPTRENGQS
jgi:CRP/FNR family transcriptional regulator, cyclic AMP receptor protein